MNPQVKDYVTVAVVALILGVSTAVWMVMPHWLGAALFGAVMYAFGVMDGRKSQRLGRLPALLEEVRAAAAEVRSQVKGRG